MITNAKIKLNLIRLKIFFMVLATIFIFYVFGKNNLVIGIGTIIIASTMFGEDYTADISTTTILLVIINILIGIFAYITTLNPFWGLIITFFTIFIISYSFTYDAKPLKSVGFINMYLMLVYSPVNLYNMPLRLVALAFSGIILTIIYYTLSKYNFNKITTKGTVDVIDLIKEEINLILKDESINDKNKSINIKLKSIKLTVYKRMENSKKDLNSVYIKNMIIVLLERINSNLPFIKKKESNILLLENLSRMCDDIKLYILNEDNLENLKINLEMYYKNLEIDKIKNDIDKYTYYSLKASIYETSKCIEHMDDIKSIYINERIKLIKLIKDNMYSFKNNFKMTSLRFNLAIKSSILIFLSVFTVNYFNIYEGKWAVYTILWLLLPYVEPSNKKALDRVCGTIIGAILFNIMYIFINGNIILMFILIFISLYLTVNTKPYNIKSIFITFNAILGVKIINPGTSTFVLSEYRVLFTIVGAILTILIINVFFPYKLKDDIKNTIIKYVNLNESILDKLEENNIDINSLHLLLITDNYYWRRLNYNNKELKCKDLESLLSNQNSFIADVTFLSKVNIYLNNDANFVKSLSQKLRPNVNEENAKEIFNSLNNYTEKLFLIHLYKIHSNIKNINLLGEKILNNL